MADHVKPSKEELKANMEAAAAALETLPPEEPVVETPVIETATEESIVETPKEKPSEEEIVIEPEKEDFRKRYADSTREAQQLAFKNKELNRAIEDAAGVPLPTEDELRKEYSEWEEMTPTEQRLASDNFQNKRKFELIHGATEKFKQVDEWNEKVDEFITDPKALIAHPELEGKIDDFKMFASKPSRRGWDFEDVVLAFNGEVAKNKPLPKKGKMFETGVGGNKEPAKADDGKLSVDEGRKLMKTDYKKYVQLLKEHKIRNE